MNLTDILDRARVLVDANIFIYAAQNRSQECRHLLSRCDDGQVEGWLTTVAIAEVCHRRMMDEAKSKGMVSSNPAKALSQKANMVRQLSIYAEDIRDILNGKLLIEPVLPSDFLVALELQTQHGLLTNDALNLAVAKRLGIQEIATADANFDPVAGLIVYKPSDTA